MTRAFFGLTIGLALLLGSAAAQEPAQSNADQSRSAEIARIRARIAEHEAEIKTLTTQLEAQIAEHRAQLEKLHTDSGRIKARIAEIEAQLAELQARRSPSSQAMPQPPPIHQTPKSLLRFSPDIERAMLRETQPNRQRGVPFRR